MGALTAIGCGGTTESTGAQTALGTVSFTVSTPQTFGANSFTGPR